MLPACLLLAVAMHQIVSSWNEGLNPWKGGGFGMFATADRGSLRQVRVIQLAPEGEVPLLLSDAVEVQRRAAQELPRDANLRALAEAVAVAEGMVGTLRVEVWRARFDLNDLQWQHEKFREGSYPIGTGFGVEAKEHDGALR